MVEEILSSFTAKNGKRVAVRLLRWEDLDDLVDLTNSFADEKMYAGIRRVTREEEAEKLGKILVKIVKKESLYVVAEADGRVVGVASVERDTSPTIEHSGHGGELSIRIMKGYRNIGIGTEMMKVLLDLCRDIGMKLVILATAATNTLALHLYEKVGFREYGRVSKQIYDDGKYIDCIWMVKEL